MRSKESSQYDSFSNHSAMSESTRARGSSVLEDAPHVAAQDGAHVRRPESALQEPLRDPPVARSVLEALRRAPDAVVVRAQADVLHARDLDRVADVIEHDLEGQRRRRAL